MKKKYVYDYNKICEICKKSFVTQRFSTKICSSECVKIRLSQRRKYTPEQMDKAIQMKLSGASQEEIEKGTGIKIPTQTQIFKERNIKLTEEQTRSLLSRRWAKHSPIVDNKKLCPQCKEMKEITEFHKNKNRITGLVSRCKECYRKFSYEPNKEVMLERVKEYREANKEVIKEKSARYYEENKEQYKQKANKWSIENPEKRKEIERQYNERNPGAKNHRTSLYRANKRHATPPWLTEKQKDEIKQIYKNCPSGYHVDHIIPISAENMCGLHVPWNLQYLPEYENESKSNKVIEELEIGTCHQYKRKKDTEQEDKELGMPFGSKLEEFTIKAELYSPEHRKLIERYEWLGTMGYSPKWIFTARYNGILGGVVIISEPNSYTKHAEIEALISRGATASWTPINLGSKLLMFACNETVKNTNKRVFFGYSDHTAGEIGTIYQACNFLYLGNSFGSRTMYELKNGKKVTSRYFRKTSTYKKYAKELGVEWKPEWTKTNKYMDIPKMPQDVMELLKDKGKNEQLNTTVCNQSPKGKYVLFLGKNKKEQRRIKNEYDKIFGNYKKYPKRNS